MSIRVVASVLSFSEAKLAERLTLIAIADNAHDDGIAWPTEEEIGRKAKLGVSSVRKAVGTLIEKGELEIRKVQRGRRRINVYRVLCGKPHDVEYDRLPFEVNDKFTTARIERPSNRRPPESPVDDRQNSLARHKEPSVEPSVGRKTTSSSPAEPRKKDLVWDALTATLFVPHTKHEEKRIGQAARELRAAVKLEFGDMNGALDAKCAEEIVRRMANYPPEWSSRTPEALVKHWTDLGAGGDGAERARVADRLRRMAEHDGGKGAK